MKQVKIALLALLVFVGFNKGFAQDKNNPWGIKIGVNAVDYHPTNFPGNRTEVLGVSSGWFEEFFNAEDHYNIIPTISSLQVSRYLNDGFSLDLGASVNKISKVGNNPETNPGDLPLLALDGTVNYALMNLFGKEGKWFDPYLSLGGGYTWLDWEGTGTLNGGAGINFWLTDNVAFNVASKYKHSFDDMFAPYFQHTAGLAVKFGGTDEDKDGIYDKDDACPKVFGLATFKGCPDTDGDGIQDSEDKCPEVAGPAEYKGCPDTDGDGIIDIEDACPQVKGLAAFKGCPDTDGDGVADKDDACPTVAGPKENKGCVWPDTDKDGILDKDDACPTVFGVKEEKGCPAKPKEVIITQEHKDQLKSFAKAIYFNTGQDSFKPGVTEKLDQIAAIMKQYPDAKFTIDGYTDSVGGEEMNQTLSEKRAAAVKNYLVKKGVTDRLISAGYGESHPIGDNNTAAGRAENRRVEINLVK